MPGNVSTEVVKYFLQKYYDLDQDLRLDPRDLRARGAEPELSMGAVTSTFVENVRANTWRAVRLAAVPVRRAADRLRRGDGLLGGLRRCGRHRA